MSESELYLVPSPAVLDVLLQSVLGEAAMPVCCYAHVGDDSYGKVHIWVDSEDAMLMHVEFEEHPHGVPVYTSVHYTVKLTQLTMDATYARS